MQFRDATTYLSKLKSIVLEVRQKGIETKNISRNISGNIKVSSCCLVLKSIKEPT